jgi:anti-sigma regulatory factor (Ser/Thr protein kinase)
VQGEHAGIYDPTLSAGVLVLAIMLGFSMLLWSSARRLSRSAAAQRESEEALRRAEAHKQEFYRRTILAATGGKLVITEQDEIDAIAGPAVVTMDIKTPDDLPKARKAATDTAGSAGMEKVQVHKLLMAVGESTSNAYKHAGEGLMSVHRTDNGVVVVVSDHGPGIDALNLPDVALTTGYSTAGTGGYGYEMILAASDKVYLATGPDGTTVAFEVGVHRSTCLPPDPTIR